MPLAVAPRPILTAFPSFTPHNTSPNGQSDYSDPTTQVLTPSVSDIPFPFASARIPPPGSPHVHFPPTPIMTRMQITHSRSYYDRKPIVVSPNVCALPGRGERDVDALEDVAEGYFGFLPPPHECGSANVKALAETSPLAHSFSLTGGTSGTGSCPISPSIATGTIRTRNHSLPLPQALAPRPHPNPRRHTDPYPDPYHLPVPSLIFDHSSEESDSEDMCSSPPAAESSFSAPGLGIPHISLHFPGGMSTSMAVMESESFLEPKLKTRTGSRTRTKRREHPQNDSDLPGSDVVWISVEPVMDAAGPMTSARRIRDGNTHNIDTPGSAGRYGLSSFCEPALDDCLGGF